LKRFLVYASLRVEQKPEGSNQMERLREGAAARYLGVAPKTLQKWRAKGSGPRYAKLGSARCAVVVYSPPDLDDFLRKCQREPKAGPCAPPQP